MARSLSKQFNKALKQRLNEVKASPAVRKMAFNMAEERVEAARKVLAKEFDEHEVTQSLETRNYIESQCLETERLDFFLDLIKFHKSSQKLQDLPKTSIVGEKKSAHFWLFFTF